VSLKKIELKYNQDLKEYTTIKIGGVAKYFFVAHSVDDLTQLMYDTDRRFYLLGAGSNLLVSSGIITKPVVKLGEAFDYIRSDFDTIEVGAATLFKRLSKYLLQNNLTGLESLVGIPATVGGMLAMNASSFGSSIASCVRQVEVMDMTGAIRKIDREDIYFGYRRSSLKSVLLLRAWFQFKECRDVKLRLRAFFNQRLRNQDFNFPSCGCIFKNPSGCDSSIYPASDSLKTPKSLSAGFLIEACGLKGLRKNDACVSLKHANFIINMGCARYDDVDYLICTIKEEIYKRYGILLEEEIERWL
jgi:UDP-N-acetylmuramate dehydrogenase